MGKITGNAHGHTAAHTSTDDGNPAANRRLFVQHINVAHNLGVVGAWKQGPVTYVAEVYSKGHSLRLPGMDTLRGTTPVATTASAKPSASSLSAVASSLRRIWKHEMEKRPRFNSMNTTSPILKTTHLNAVLLQHGAVVPQRLVKLFLSRHSLCHVELERSGEHGWADEQGCRKQACGCQKNVRPTFFTHLSTNRIGLLKQRHFVPTLCCFEIQGKALLVCRCNQPTESITGSPAVVAQAKPAGPEPTTATFLGDDVGTSTC